MDNDESPVTNNIDCEIITGIRKFIEHMENVRGIEVHRADVKEMKYAFETSASMLLQLNGVDTIYKKGSDPRVSLSTIVKKFIDTREKWFVYKEQYTNSNIIFFEYP